MAEPWFKAAFGGHYSELYAHRDDAEARSHLPQIESLARLKDLQGPILDCGCGTGRYTRLLREKGHIVHGLDYSPDLLRQAATTDLGKGGWVRGDMLRLPFVEVFTRVLSLFTSFGYFEEKQNRQVLQGMVSSLREGGLLYLDFLNAKRVVSSDWEEYKRGELSFRSRKIITEGRQDVLKDVQVYREEDLLTSYQERVKLYEQDWFEENLEAQGARLLKVFGDYSGAPYGSESPRLIILAQKRAVS